MRAVRMAWRLGRVTAGAFEPNAELGHRPHRCEGCLRYFNEWNALIGAGNREVTVLELDVARVRFQHGGRHQLCLVDNRIGGSAERTAPDIRAARALRDPHSFPTRRPP